MSKTTVLAITIPALLLTGCAGAIWGNLLVLGIAVGIFFGTLALGRSSSGTRSASTSTTSSTGTTS